MRAILTRTAGSVATLLGHAARLTLASLPGALGALLVAYGAWLAWEPLGFMVLGAAFLAIDRRLP